HGHDLTADDDDEAGAGREPHLAHRHGVAGRRAAQVGVGREGVLGLGHADRQVAVAGLFPGMQLVADRLVGDRLVAAIDALDDGVDLLEQRHLVGIERGELRGAGFGDLDDLPRQDLDAGGALRPVLAQDRLGALRLDEVLHRLDLGLGIGGEVVDRHHRRHAELLHVLDVAAEVEAALPDRLDVFLAEVFLLDAAIHLHGAHGGDDDGCRWLEARLAALDIEGFFGAQVDVEAGFAWEAVGDAAQRADHLAKRPVVHVYDAAPGNAAGIDAELVAPIDVVVDQRRKQVMGGGDGVEIAGEVEVHIVHRHDLGEATAGGAALHAEVRAERGLADADDGLLADAVQTVAEADRGGGLAFTGRRRVDGGDQDQLAVLVALDRLDEFGRDLRLVVAVGQQVLVRDAD